MIQHGFVLAGKVGGFKSRQLYCIRQLDVYYVRHLARVKVESKFYGATLAVDTLLDAF